METLAQIKQHAANQMYIKYIIAVLMKRQRVAMMAFIAALRNLHVT